MGYQAPADECELNFATGKFQMRQYYWSAFARASLPHTVRRAFRHPFYFDFWSDYLSVDTFPADEDTEAWTRLFHQLPAVSRDHLANEIHPELEEGDFITSVSHSTGTTGRPVYRYRSNVEATMTKSLQFDSNSATGRRRLGMQLTAPYHGAVKPSSTSGLASPYLFEGAVWEDHFIKSTIEKLQHSFEIPGVKPRVSFLQGPVRHLRILTEALKCACVDTSSLAVEKITVFGGFLSTETRRELEGFWKIAIVDRYSLSENSAGAFACAHCGYLHFDTQLLSDVTQDGVSSDSFNEYGELLLTELYPYSYCQPLVKYQTGDLVEVLNGSSACCKEHNGGVRHVGRTRHSVIDVMPDGKFKLLLGSNELREAMYCSAVKKSIEMPQLSTLHDHSAIGYPIANTEYSAQHRVLRIKFSPRSDDHKHAESVVRARLIAASPSLKAALAMKNVELEVLADPKLDCSLTK